MKDAIWCYDMLSDSQITYKFLGQMLVNLCEGKRL